MRRSALVLVALVAPPLAACARVRPNYTRPTREVLISPYNLAGPVYRAPADQTAITRVSRVGGDGTPRTTTGTTTTYVAPAPAPAAAPAGAAYGPPAAATYAPGQFRFAFQIGDELAISVWKEKDLETTQRIQRDGTISPMLLGTVVVAGKTVDEVRHDLEQRYTEYLQEPKVSVRVVSIHSERVFVLGEVKAPAAITLNGPTMLTQALSQAGGFNQEFADQRRVRIVRQGPDGRPTLITANVEAMLVGRTPIVQVMPGDVVYVPPTGLASWSRGLTQALGPISNIISTAGGVVTSYAAIKALEQSND